MAGMSVSGRALQDSHRIETRPSGHLSHISLYRRLDNEVPNNDVAEGYFIVGSLCCYGLVR